jgi:hypothetical protein
MCGWGGVATTVLLLEERAPGIYYSHQLAADGTFNGLQQRKENEVVSWQD